MRLPSSINRIETASHARRKPETGFTLVELLVVIAIIGVLVALLLPAVQAAREAARRSACTNNLKQIGLGLINHEGTHGAFPPGASGTSTAPTNFARQFTNWAIETLPYLEQGPLYDQYDQGKPNTHPDNLPVLATPLGVMKCPSADFSSDLQVATQLEHAGEIAVGSYKGVSGTRFLTINGYYDFPGYALNAGRVPEKRGPLYLVGVGDFDVVKMAHITDGLSHSLLVGEYSTIEEESGTDAVGTPFWASTHAFHNLAATQEESYTRAPDYDRCLSANGNKWWQCDRSFASFHSGVIQFVRCDGSVASIFQDIDGRIFSAMGTISGDDDLEN